jgi:CheY-like chemotaxis protein
MAWIMITPCVSAGAGVAVRGTALLVDDDIAYRQVLGEMLTEEGWDVIETSTGEDALTFSGIEGKPSLLVTDINLGGGMDGWALGRLARDQWPDVGLLFISGENQRHQQHHHLLQEVFLLKPFRRSDFLTAVAEVARTAATGTESRP